MRVNTLPLQYTHRDMMNRVIRMGDHVVWSNGKYGQSMKLCTVENATEQKVNIRVIGSRSRSTVVYPNNLMVVTAQVERNLEGNVGANLDLEATR